ncbi:hypothetical protein ACH5RR_019239 [Cinchona calisaya]|uniref:HMA domain-containing protein n=1 Tax=Cinchona calisaya TaxID=153742 RepID=A0ABD2ZNT2_9GENT
MSNYTSYTNYNAEQISPISRTMAYSQLPLVAPSSFILKLKIHCSKCENKLKRMILKVQGVHSVNIDAKQGTVTISGTVEPSTIMKWLEGLGRKAELLWEQNHSSSSSSSTIDGQHNLQIIAESKMVDERFNDPNVVAQLQQLSGIKGLKNVEIAYFKTIKLTFKGEKDQDFGDQNVEVTIRDGVYSPQIPQGSGICGASASCCGGHHHRFVNKNMNEIVGCCGNHAAAGYPIASNVCALNSCNSNMYWKPHACGGVPPAGNEPPWPGYNSPSAPPLGTNYVAPTPPPPPPTMGYSYSSPFSDDNPSGGCNIM